jgi:hypothetical protein
MTIPQSLEEEKINEKACKANSNQEDPIFRLTFPVAPPIMRRFHSFI